MTTSDFLRRMEAAGYEVRRRGDSISFRAPGQERYTRLRENTLSMDYTVERITQRIQGKKRAVSTPKRDSKTVSLVIDIENSIKAQQSRGYEQRAKIHNLKQAAKTVNFLTENNILQYTDLSAKVTEVAAASEQAGNGGKLPNAATLQGSYAQLVKEKDTLYAEYGKLKEQVKEYAVIKQNVDSLLKQPEAEKHKDRDAEL